MDNQTLPFHKKKETDINLTFIMYTFMKQYRYSPFFECYNAANAVSF